jgi:hypothetical protein
MGQRICRSAIAEGAPDELQLSTAEIEQLCGVVAELVPSGGLNGKGNSDRDVSVT